LYKDWQRREEKIPNQFAEGEENFFLLSPFIFLLENPQWMLRAFGKCTKIILPALAQCLAAPKRERGNSVQPLRNRHKCHPQTLFRLWQRRDEFSSPTSQLGSTLAIKKKEAL
jgi:hypothetical protein